MRCFQLTWLCVALSALGACGGATPQQDCEVESTFEAVQQLFETNGCTASTCHGNPVDEAEGKLDLREGFSFDALMNGEPQAGTMSRLFPGDEELSLLYVKLAAATNRESLPNGIAGGAMPAAGRPLDADELELVRLWIRSGAPEQGFVADTDAVLKCNAVVDTAPNKIPPPDVPAADVGIQFYSGAWSLPAESEDETCFVTYYNYADRIPEQFQFDCDERFGGSERKCFSFNGILLSQDPQSHHAIVERYAPPANKQFQWEPDSEDWKNWQCLGGQSDGASCDPKDEGFCGERSACATAPQTAVACALYSNGPRELSSIAGFGGAPTANRIPVTIAQEFIFREDFANGVYETMPVEGFVIWNSHAFNLTNQDTTIEQWLTLEFSQPSERQFIRRQLFEAEHIFEMGPIPAFTTHQICATFTMPRYSRMLTLSTHYHKRGALFEVWYPPNAPCDPGASCQPRTDRDPEYTNRLYNDPLYQRFTGSEPKIQMDAAGVNDRTFKYCAVYDNGQTNPSRVKRDSVRADAETCELLDLVEAFVDVIPDGFRLPVACGCQPEEQACYGGRDQGMLCGGDDGMCRDGVCDACPLQGGVTTEDEMFAILGSWYQTTPDN